MKLIVADSGPLIIMARSGHLAFLVEVAGQVLVTQTVYAECVTTTKPGALALQSSTHKGLIQLIPDMPASDVLARAQLDPGEKAALAAAVALSCPVLVDERKARQVARQHSLAVIGSAGILLKGKKLGLVKQIRPILEEWKSYGYFLSDALPAQVLELAGESGLERPKSPRGEI